jgi:PAS domain S-box-containing protein
MVKWGMDQGEPGALRAGQVRGMNCSTDLQDITHPDDLEADLKYVRETLAGEQRAYQIEKRYIHKDGSTVWILLGVSLMRDDQGEPHFFIAQMRDISARRMEQRWRHFSRNAQRRWKWSNTGLCTTG